MNETVLIKKICIALWILGGCLALLITAHNEKKRLGGTLFEALFKDRHTLLVPMTTGLILLFCFGNWISVLYELLRKVKYHGTK